MNKKVYTIKELMDELRLNQTQFAEEVGVSFQSVNKWIGGKMIPSTNRLRKIEQKYGVLLDYRRK